MNYPNDLKYTKEHLWVKVNGETATVGITDFAQDQLGDVLYVDLPADGDTFANGALFAEVESSKTASELHLPFAGEVVKVNEDLDDSPELLNEDPYTNWIAEFKVEDIAAIEALLSAADYQATL